MKPTQASAVPTIWIVPSVTSAVHGRVAWSPSKSLWVSAMYAIAIVGGYTTPAWENVWVFLITTAITLCLGHSLGMHRRLIHQSYQCPKWLEYVFVHFGVLVGLAGPFGLARTHDMRDWAQRQPHCHDYFAHRRHMLQDSYWQIHCDIQLAHPPEFKPESILSNDPVYHWMERTWMWQQLPWAILLGLCGGIGWVVWGIAVRVAVCVTGHWLIGYIAHNTGHRTWHVEGASAQGYNIPFCGLITMGECWHNNHHAFPGSAKLGLQSNQLDPGWWVLLLLQKMGFVWDIRLPTDLAFRQELTTLKTTITTKGQAV